MKKYRTHIAFKSILGIVLLLIVFAVLVSIIGYRLVTNALLEQYAQGAFLTAHTAAPYVNADRMNIFTQNGSDTAAYQATYNNLDYLCNTTGATFIYVIQPDLPDYGHITFVFSTINHETRYTQYDYLYYRQTTNEEYKQKYRALYEGTSQEELVIRDKGYIETDPHITAMVPLKDSDGKTQAILCVQRQMDRVVTARNAYIRKVTLTMAVLMLVVIVGQGIYLHFTILDPLKTITTEASRFAKENVKQENKLKDTIRNRDEIGVLAESIDQMEEQIEEYVENLTSATAEKERIGTELSLATRIQEGMLPSTFPAFPDRDEFEVFATMNAAREVGGDFYDFFLVDDDHLGLVIADVSGKGIPAALFMMASRIIIQNNSMSGKTPAQVLQSTNHAICKNNEQEMFVTVWMGILEISTGILTAANAGHEYPAVMNAQGEFELLKDPHGFVIGGMDGMKYREYELRMRPGDKLFVYTDGVPEAMAEDGTMFGTDRMLEALNEVRDAAPQQILQHVQESVDTYVKEAEPFDDLTMLCVEYKGGHNG